ncbi:Chorismate lyase [Methylorubrum populi]
MMKAAIRMLMVGLATLGTAALPGEAGSAQAQVAETSREAQDGPEARALIETLSARLLAAPSATAILEAWCAERGLSPDPRIVAVRVPGVDKPAGAARRERLAVGPEEPVRYRRVRLTCGRHVLSEADNWYVPSRLTPEMNAALDGTQAPFGRVVRPLGPSRRNLSLTMLWQPEKAGMPGPAEPLFSVEAVLSAGGVPFCEVAETYTGAVLIQGDR